MYKYLLNLHTLQIINSVTPESHTKPLLGKWRVDIATIEISQSSRSRKERDLGIIQQLYLAASDGRPSCEPQMDFESIHNWM